MGIVCFKKFFIPSISTANTLSLPDVNISSSRVLVLGLTFKEDCPDLRNSKVADVVSELEEYGCQVCVHDPLADKATALHEYGIVIADWDQLPKNIDALVLAVGHEAYRAKPLSKLLAKLKPGGVVIDLKSVLDRQAISNAGFNLWRL